MRLSPSSRDGAQCAKVVEILTPGQPPVQAALLTDGVSEECLDQFRFLGYVNARDESLSGVGQY